MEKELISEFAKIVRASTIKRLVKVPENYENWKIKSDSLSFAEITKHLIDIDNWILSKIQDPSFKSIETQTARIEFCKREKYLDLIDELQESLVKKPEFIDKMTEEDLQITIYDDSLSKNIPTSLFILRRNLDHEIHHRGQIALYLNMLKQNK